MKERWKDVDGFPGYQVSNKGRVRSRVNNRHGLGDKWHEIKPVNSNHGYKTVCFGRGNRRLVHRLVANAFIENPDSLPIVRHLDDNPQNNSFENLAWGTQTDNMQDCVKHGRLVGNTKNAIASRYKPVVARKIGSDEELYFKSYNEAGRCIGIDSTHICDVVNGKLKQTHGWTFKKPEVKND